MERRYWYRIIEVFPLVLLWNHSPGSVVNHPVLNIDTWALLLITLRHRLIYEKIRKKLENKNSMICVCSATYIVEWTRHQVCSTRTCTRPCRFASAILQSFFFSILHACRIHYLVNSEKQDWTVSDRCSSVYTLKQTAVRHGKAVFLMCSTRGRTKS